MAKVTWKGEPGNSQESMDWRGHTFKKGEAVDIDDEETVNKAKGNQFFEVSDEQPQAKPTMTPAPSTQGAQGPVPKPGEPQPASPSPGQQPKK